MIESLRYLYKKERDNYMKKTLAILLMLMMFVSTAFLSACGSKSEVPEDSGEPAAGEPADTDADADTVKVVDALDEIDTEDMLDLPLQIESITLFEDGTLRIVPTGDLLKNAETNNEITDDAAYPFGDSGKVQKFYLVRYGNGGYRTIICIMDDGTLSALSAKELIEDHIFIVMDNVTGRDTYVDVKQTENEDAFGAVGVTEDGEEIELDFSLDF